MSVKGIRDYTGKKVYLIGGSTGIGFSAAGLLAESEGIVGSSKAWFC